MALRPHKKPLLSYGISLLFFYHVGLIFFVHLLHFYLRDLIFVVYLLRSHLLIWLIQWLLCTATFFWLLLCNSPFVWIYAYVFDFSFQSLIVLIPIFSFVLLFIRSFTLSLCNSLGFKNLTVYLHYNVKVFLQHCLRVNPIHSSLHLISSSAHLQPYAMQNYF